MSQKASLELKVEALGLLKTGLSISSVSKQLKIPSGVLQTWSQIYAKEGVKGVTSPVRMSFFHLGTLCCSEILDCPFVEKIEHKHKVFRRKFLIWIVKQLVKKHNTYKKSSKYLYIRESCSTFMAKYETTKNASPKHYGGGVFYHVEYQ